ncbi:MAG: 4-hydroxy-tetrahydrodipicolinate reductase [Bacteroidetes bacterium]|nr:4-hydroxy-tetrahydrodipicolinate reductase [Bacteroidota bacterium]
MKIAITGYGKMGKEIEKAALRNGDSVVAVIDSPTDWNEQLQEIKEADVIIDFSQPDVAVEIFLKSFALNKPVVTGTTGWNDQLEMVRKKCIETDATLFYAPNFSIGVNIFFKLNRELARIMNQVDGYGVKVKETHHIQKIDAPSGTAIKTGEDIILHTDELKSWVNKASDDPTELPIISKRKGKVTGTHKVIYKSNVDEIELIHKAKSRAAFTQGALLAAAFVKDKKGIFTMEDLINY